MGLFKSKEERRIERDMEIRRGLNLMRRNIKELEKNSRAYVQKAKRAKQIGAKSQYEFLRSTIKRTASQQRMLERQLLNIETALQIKNQAESHGAFCKSMNAVSQSIGELFGTMDIGQSEKDFEKAMMQAETMEQRMEMFLDMSSQSMMGTESAGEDLVSDQEIDAWIDESVAASESVDLDAGIAEGLEEIEKELGK